MNRGTIAALVFASFLMSASVQAMELSPGDPVLEQNPQLRTLVQSSGGHVEAVFRKAGVHPTYLSGTLSAQTGLAEQTSAQFLLQNAGAFGIPQVEHLKLYHVFDVGTGSVVRYHQVVDGVPVEYSGVAVRTDVSGRVLAVSADVLDVTGVDTTPALDRGHGLVLAHEALLPTYLAHTGDDVTQLVLLPLPDGSARLAWKVYMGAVPALMSNPIVYVDAHSGETLLVRNAVWFDRLAHVYTQNPVDTPDLVEVTLTNLPVDSTHLTGDRTIARNCIDQHETIPIEIMGMSLNVHMCTEMQKATADASGDFIYTPDELDPEDDFAEAQMYYSVEAAYAYYQSRGFDLLDEVPIPATVNFRMPVDMYGTIDMSAIMAAQDPYGELYAFDNAMFMEAGDMMGIMDRDTDSMVFGQGTEGDFAFDGDVITHEFGHAVVASTCGLTMYSLDEQGLDASTGALNEAYADTGAFASTEDSTVGDYAGSWLTGGGIRDVDADNTCPGDVTGESHEDSLMFTGAEWDMLEAFTGEEDTVKQAFYNAEITLNATSDFDEASAALVSEIRTALGDTAGDTAQGIVDAHNLQGCQRVITLTTGENHSKMMHLPAQAMVMVGPIVPGPLQFHYNPGRAFQQLTVHFAILSDPTSMLFGGEMEPVVLLKRGADPITFEYTGGMTSGDWDLEQVAVEGAASTWTATFWFEGEGIPDDDYHIVIGSQGSSGFIAAGIHISVTDDPIPSDDPGEPVAEEADETPEPVDEVEPVPDADTDAPDDGNGKDSGCGCSIVS